MQETTEVPNSKFCPLHVEHVLNQYILNCFVDHKTIKKIKILKSSPWHI